MMMPKRPDDDDDDRMKRVMVQAPPRVLLSGAQSTPALLAWWTAVGRALSLSTALARWELKPDSDPVEMHLQTDLKAEGPAPYAQKKTPVAGATTADSEP